MTASATPRGGGAKLQSLCLRPPGRIIGVALLIAAVLGPAPALSQQVATRRAAASQDQPPRPASGTSGAEADGLTEVGRHSFSNKWKKPWKWNKPHNNEPAEQNTPILNCAAQLSGKNGELDALRQQLDEYNATLLDYTSGVENLFAKANADELRVLVILFVKAFGPVVSNPPQESGASNPLQELLQTGTLLQELLAPISRRGLLQTGTPQQSSFGSVVCGLTQSALDALLSDGKSNICEYATICGC